MAAQQKFPYKVVVYFFEGNGKGKDCLGEGNANAVYTLKTAKELLGSWKGESRVRRGELLLDGKVLLQWERKTRQEWPVTAAPEERESAR